MKKENVSFLLYLSFGLILSIIGIVIIAFNTIIELELLYQITGVLSYVFGLMFLYLMSRSIPSIAFKIKKQKRIMLFLVTFSWIWLLSGVTAILYIIILYFVILNKELSTFYYIIFAGFSGGLWSVGLTEVYHFWNFTKYGKNFSLNFDWSRKGSRIDWYTAISFKKNLHRWIRYFVISVILWIGIMFIIAIIL